MDSARLRLTLPLAAVFAVCFVAPLWVLLSVSFHGETGGLTTANYSKFFTDSFNTSILLDTLWLGVKATVLCLLFGYPIAWISSRSSPLMWSCSSNPMTPSMRVNFFSMSI